MRNTAHYIHNVKGVHLNVKSDRPGEEHLQILIYDGRGDHSSIAIFFNDGAKIQGNVFEAGNKDVDPESIPERFRRVAGSSMDSAE